MVPAHVYLVALGCRSMEAEADLLGFGMPEADFGMPEGAVLSVAAAAGGGGGAVATDVRGAGRLSLLLAGRVSFLGEGMELVEAGAAEEVRGAGMPLAGAEVRVSLRVGAGSALTATVTVAGDAAVVVAGGRLLGAAAACAVVVVVVGVAFEERWGEARDRVANVGEGIKLAEEEEEEDMVRVVVAGVVLAGVAEVVVREEVELVAVGFAAVVFSGRRFSLLTARIAFAKSGVAACNTRSYSSSLRNAMPSAMSCGVRSSLSKMSTSSASRVRSSVKGMPNKLTRFLFWSISMASPSSRFVHTDSKSFAEGEVL